MAPIESLVKLYASSSFAFLSLVACVDRARILLNKDVILRIEDIILFNKDGILYSRDCILLRADGILNKKDSVARMKYCNVDGLLLLALGVN